MFLFVIEFVHDLAQYGQKEKQTGKETKKT